MARTADPNKRNDILNAATRVFAQKGYAAARMIEVAEAAAVGKGTIYEYFRSKEDLFYAVFEAMIHDAGTFISEAAQKQEGSFAARLYAMSDGLIESWLAQLDMYALVMEFWSATASAPSRDRFKRTFQQGYARLRTVVGDLIGSAQNAGEVRANIDARQVASALIGTWDALLLQAWLDPKFDALGASRAFLSVVLRGLAAGPQSRER